MTDRQRIIAGTICVALLAGGALLAGPPLICPKVVLSPDERASLGAAGSKKAPLEDAIRDLIAVLDRMDTGRIHMEAVRFFFMQGHSSEAAGKALIDALQRRVDRAGKRKNHDLARYDLAIARVIYGYHEKGALEWVDTMAQVADARGDAMLLIGVSEALDLVGDSARSLPHHLLGRLSLDYYERALELLAAGDDGGDPLARELVKAHLPFIRGMHSRDWDWERLEKKWGDLARAK
ncbi:MAG: hypothetical protein ACE5GW_02005 [Planctomycetota bacterium]